MKKPVLSKADFLRRFKKGEFGNAPPTWETVEEYLESDYKGLVHLRNKKKAGRTYYNVNKETVKKFPSKNEFYISGMAPHEHGTIQGEVMRSEFGLVLTYFSAKYPMREAFKKCSIKITKGVLSNQILEHHMCVNSYEWVCELLENYPEHVVEFSCFECAWGSTPNRNTVIWEVRKY